MGDYDRPDLARPLCPGCGVRVIGLHGSMVRCRCGALLLLGPTLNTGVRPAWRWQPKHGTWQQLH
jgi:hypothetical protein